MLAFGAGIDSRQFVGRETKCDDLCWLGASSRTSPPAPLESIDVESCLCLGRPGSDLFLRHRNAVDRLFARHAQIVIRKYEVGDARSLAVAPGRETVSLECPARLSLADTTPADMPDDRSTNEHPDPTADRTHLRLETKEQSNARRHQLVGDPPSCGMTGIACKPGYVGKNATDRRKARRREAAAKAVTAAKEQVLIERWGSRLGALDRVSEISRRLDELRADELRMLLERDDIVVALRDVEVPWTHLASRTGLSRQALNKRLMAAQEQA